MLVQLSTHPTTAPGDLTELLTDCHGRIRYFLRLAQRAAHEPPSSADAVSEACARVERYFTLALPLHVVDEEHSIAPRLRGLDPAVDEALREMSRQHRRQDATLIRFLAALSRVQRTPTNSAELQQLARHTSALMREMDEHLALEEAVIFPAIGRLLSSELQTAIIGELRKRRQPPASRVAPGAGRTSR